MTTEQICERIDNSGFKETTCIDGSSFDSTQHYENRVIVEGEFLQRIHGWLVDVFSHPDNIVNGLSPKEAADLFVKEAMVYDLIVFVKAPEAS